MGTLSKTLGPVRLEIYGAGVIYLQPAINRFVLLRQKETNGGRATEIWYYVISLDSRQSQFLLSSNSVKFSSRSNYKVSQRKFE